MEVCYELQQQLLSLLACVPFRDANALRRARCFFTFSLPFDDCLAGYLFEKKHPGLFALAAATQEYLTHWVSRINSNKAVAWGKALPGTEKKQPFSMHTYMDSGIGSVLCLSPSLSLYKVVSRG